MFSSSKIRLGFGDISIARVDDENFDMLVIKNGEAVLKGLSMEDGKVSTTTKQKLGACDSGCMITNGVVLSLGNNFKIYKGE